MEISAALAADLHDLTTALDHPGPSLQQLLAELTADIHLAVRSYLGLSMTFIIDDYPAIFTALDDYTDPTDITTSLLLPLAALSTAEPGSSLILYAATPGAFVDLAADLSFALHLNPDQVILDRHLTPPPPESTLTGLSTMNQAIGILIDQGHTPTTAHAELHRRAHHHNNPTTAAHHLIHTTTRPPSSTDPPMR